MTKRTELSVSRRDAITAAVAAPLLCAATPAAPRTFLLVHGAWHGGWCWRDVASFLRSSGHRVFTPTLTGLGERAHLRSPAVDLEIHIADIVNTIEVEELSRVTLVGHSYGGMVVTGVADRMPCTIERLIYLDAVVPEHGHSMFDFQPAGERERAKAVAIDGWLMAPPSVEVLGLDPGDQRTGGWVTRRLTPHPIATWEQPLRLSQREMPPRHFIHCTSPNLFGMFDRFATHALQASNWKFSRLATGHDAMVSAPRNLVRELLS